VVAAIVDPHRDPTFAKSIQTEILSQALTPVRSFAGLGTRHQHQIAARSGLQADGWGPGM